jgi:hypothetical protein
MTHALKQRSSLLFTMVTGVLLSQLKIDQSARAKQSVLWTGNELVTRYTYQSFLKFARLCFFLACYGSSSAAILPIMTFWP